MPNFVFLIDTSGSMNQRTIYGTTFLDIAKGAIENFLKIRQKSGSFSSDRFMLLSTDEFPKNIKVNWVNDSQWILNELKLLQAKGVTLLGNGFKTAFDLLNINRMISRIDNYGMGRNPWYLEPTLIMCLTDGHCFSSNKGPENELTLPLSTIRGSELTTEPYRWDQRVFSLVLQIPGIGEPLDTSNQSGVPVSDNTALNDLCEVTGGRSYKITTTKVLNQCLESISQKVLHGVVLKFICNTNINKHLLNNALFKKISLKKEKELTNGYANGIDNSNNNSNNNDKNLIEHKFAHCQKMIFVKNVGKGQPNGQWPIPEPYFSDHNNHELSPRTAHPEVVVVTQDVEPLECDYITPDIYEVEPCPMAQLILQKKSSRPFAWPVFISKSGPTEGSFGYLKAHEARKVVNLHVYPYNYPQLFPLLNELVKGHKVKPPTEWCKRFDAYVSTMPLYYAMPMREALKKLGAGHLVPESLDYGQNHNISNYLKNLSQLAKQENERILALVCRQERISRQNPPINIIPNNSLMENNSTTQQPSFDQLISTLSSSDITDSLSSKNTNSNSAKSAPSLDIIDPHLFAGFSIPNIDPTFKPDRFRNPFDIRRVALVDQVSKMRNNFMALSFWGRPFYDMVDKHNISISAMGNYQSVANKVAPLREIDPTPPRQHAFGNPYKLAGGADRDKMMIDETEDFDEHQVASLSSNQNGLNPNSTSSSLPFSSSNKRGGASWKDQMHPMVYKPGKRIKLPNMPPSVYESRNYANGAKDLHNKVRDRSKLKKPVNGLELTAGGKNVSSMKANTCNKLTNGNGNYAIVGEDDVMSLSDGQTIKDMMVGNANNNGGCMSSDEASDGYLMGSEPPEFDVEKWKKHTDELVHAICRLIRFPTPYVDETVDSMCNSLEGPLHYQQSVVKFLISESNRFKRDTLTETLNKRLVNTN